jgi:uncharacterized protein with PIN domain
MKFVADVMLGSLAKLMRFAGYDVEYDNFADDEKLKKQSRHRILLTKDRPLAASIRQASVYLVKSITAQHQLEEIQQKFPTQDKSPRCMQCNGKLSRVRKKNIQHLVPPFVFKRQSNFLRCRSCSRLYWSGTHYEKMVRMLK